MSETRKGAKELLNQLKNEEIVVIAQEDAADKIAELRGLEKRRVDQIRPVFERNGWQYIPATKSESGAMYVNLEIVQQDTK